VISTTTHCTAPPSRVDALLKDPASWPLWSPHVAVVDGPPGPISAGWVGSVRAFFSPVATDMTVTWAEPEQGLRWTSRALGHVLTYDNLVAADGTGSVLTWSATLTGPLARALEALAAPVSALGQRRRTTRLARLAETVHAG
jgi:hypothetical protein